MWKWFTNANADLNNSFYFEEEPHDERQLINQQDVPGTPFRVTGHPAKGYWITIGPYRITEMKPTKSEAVKDLETEKWNIIARLVQITHDFEKNIKPNLEKTTAKQ